MTCKDCIHEKQCAFNNYYHYRNCKTYKNVQFVCCEFVEKLKFIRR